MSWSYLTTLVTAKDQIRLLIGDTDTTNQLLQDEEIAYFVSTEATTYMAASRAARAVAAKYSRLADKQVGDLKITYAKTAERLIALAEELAAAKRYYAVPTAGGIKKADRDANQSNDALLHSFLRRGMHDFVLPPIVPNTQS